MRRVVVVLVVVGLLAGVGWWLGSRWERVPIPRFTPECTVANDAGSGRVVTLEREQMANAATVSAVGVRMAMPDRAVVVALATAMQESRLRNLPHLGPQNDHDSIGLFQQRPSQGWGTEEEISDPRYAAERFYAALREVSDWQELRVTDAAQRVQRSAFPEAYQQWARDAEVLAAALLGQTSAAVSCAASGDPRVRGDAATDALGDALADDWGELPPLALVDPAGLVVDPVDHAEGWRYAHWLVSHAARHGVVRVQFDDLEWTPERGEWSQVDPVGQVVVEVAPVD